MNQSNSTIELSSSSQPEIRQERVALYMRDVFYLSNVLCEQHQIWININKSLNSKCQLQKLQEDQIQTKLLLFRTILMGKKKKKIAPLKNIFVSRGSICHGKQGWKYRLPESCQGRGPKVRNCINHHRYHFFCLRVVFTIFYTGSFQVPPEKNNPHLKC